MSHLLKTNIRGIWSASNALMVVSTDLNMDVHFWVSSIDDMNNEICKGCFLKGRFKCLHEFFGRFRINPTVSVKMISLSKGNRKRLDVGSSVANS